jgi:YwiC-like protein
MSTSISRDMPKVRLRLIALPVEHGGWGFLGEPILLGLAVAPSIADIGLTMAAIGVFLIFQPLQLVATDWRKGRRYPRTIWAERFVAIYGTIAFCGFILALLSARHVFLLPLLFAIPCAVGQVVAKIYNHGRDLFPEVLGAIALGATAPAMAMAAGWTLIPALSLWLLLAGRAVVSIIYVRARLRRAHGRLTSNIPTIASHTSWFLISGILAGLHQVPFMAPLAFFILLVRGFIGLTPSQRNVPAKIIGFQELGFGLLTVLLLAVGYHFF